MAPEFFVRRLCRPWYKAIVATVELVNGAQLQMKALFDFDAIQEGDLSFRQGTKLLVTIEYVSLFHFVSCYTDGASYLNGYCSLMF